MSTVSPKEKEKKRTNNCKKWARDINKVHRKITANGPSVYKTTFKSTYNERNGN